MSAEIAFPSTPTDGWRQAWMTDEWVAWWTSLDHTGCSQYSLRDDLPLYQMCHSMHCPDCGKSTGAQGHRFCPERPAPAPLGVLPVEDDEQSQRLGGITW